MASYTMSMVSVTSLTEVIIRFSSALDASTSSYTFKATPSGASDISLAVKSGQSGSKTDWTFTCSALPESIAIAFSGSDSATPTPDTFTGFNATIAHVVSGGYTHSYTLAGPFTKTTQYQIKITVANPDDAGNPYVILSDPFFLSNVPDTTKSMLTVIKPYLVHFIGSSTSVTASLVDTDGNAVSDGYYDITFTKQAKS